jgi:hypothetical protein
MTPSNGYECSDSSPQARRVKFTDTGDYWAFRRFVTVGVARDVMPLVWGSIQENGQGELDVRPEDPEIARKLMAATDALVLGSTLEWSYGPIDKATLDSLPLHHFDIIKGMMEALYVPFFVESVRSSLNAFSSLSKDGSRSPAS